MSVVLVAAYSASSGSRRRPMYSQNTRKAAQDRFLDQLTLEHQQAAVAIVPRGENAAGIVDRPLIGSEGGVEIGNLLGVDRALAAESELCRELRFAQHALAVVEVEIGHVDDI